MKNQLPDKLIQQLVLIGLWGARVVSMQKYAKFFLVSDSLWIYHSIMIRIHLTILK